MSTMLNGYYYYYYYIVSHYFPLIIEPQAEI